MNIQSSIAQGAAKPPESAAHHGRNLGIGAVALVLVLGGFYYWSHAGNDSGARKPAAVPVTVALASQRDMAVVKNTIGTVIANSTVSVTARVQGQLTKAYFKEGQMVKQGDLLFAIDPRPYQAALTQAQGQLARDQAALTSAEADARRYATLFAQNAISTQQRDQSAALAAADAALVTSDKGAVEAARLNVEFAQIRSPVDGKTGPMLLQPGNLVSVNGQTTPLVTITQIKPIKVSFNLPQSDLPRIQAQAAKSGLTARLDPHGGGGKPLVVPVDFISNAVSGTGTIELRATYPNQDEALVPGQLVDVTVALADIKNAIVVPRAAVNIGPDGDFVYVVQADRSLAQVPVTTLFDDGTDAAIAGDVHDGDKVITDGALRVTPRSKVSFAKPAAAKKGGKGRKGGGKKANPA
jgi:multidrug efflux system membrane fusion protein